MKITDLSTLSKMVQTGTLPEPRTSPSPKGPTFHAALQEVNQHNVERVLQGLSEQITLQGELVGRRMDILELMRYKEMITQYVGEAVRFMYEFKKQSTFDARGRHRLYSIIKRINEKLEKMIQDMLSEQVDQLQLLAAIDDVRGMLIDMFL